MGGVWEGQEFRYGPGQMSLIVENMNTGVGTFMVIDRDMHSAAVYS